MFVVSLGAGQSLPDPLEFETLATDLPDIAFPNLNGIETIPGSDDLVIAHSVGQVLFRVNTVDGQGELIDIGVSLFGADGLIRRGNDIFVVENQVAQVTQVKVSPNSNTGQVLAVYPVNGAETPTTAGLFGNALYAVDARFGSMSGPYEVFRVELNQ